MASCIQKRDACSVEAISILSFLECPSASAPANLTSSSKLSAIYVSCFSPAEFFSTARMRPPPIDRNIAWPSVVPIRRRFNGRFSVPHQGAGAPKFAFMNFSRSCPYSKTRFARLNREKSNRSSNLENSLGNLISKRCSAVSTIVLDTPGSTSCISPMSNFERAHLSCNRRYRSSIVISMLSPRSDSMPRRTKADVCTCWYRYREGSLIDVVGK
jgi:hypothetical protein